MSDTPLPDLPAEALAAMREGRTIDAIRIVREATGLGLKEAKELVDAVAKGGPRSRFGGIPDPGSSPAVKAGLPPEAQAALDRNDTIGAIKIVRESLGLGLAEAKQLVDAAKRGRT
jgi:hypothetical protein